MDVLMDWKSMGSLYASLMFMRTALRDLIPPELHKAARSVFFYFFSNLQTKTVTVHIKEFVGRYDNDIFKSVQRYLSSKCFTSSQYLTLSKMKNSKNHTYTMIPNQSIVDIFEGIKFTWSFRTEDSGDSGSNGKSTNYFELCFEDKYKEFVNSSYLIRIAEEAKLIKSKNKGKKLYTNQSGDRWTMISQFSHPSTFDTIALDPVLKQDIQDDLKKFVSRKEFYTRVGKAWKRGYLLYGPPGTGKTSLIAAIANYLEFDIYDLELTSVRNNQDSRESLLSPTNKSIIVVEDIDCSLDLENRESKSIQGGGDGETDTDINTSNPKTGVSRVSLSGLLNFVDGLWSACAGERLIIFTTNHKEKLDPALLRAGRMDKHILLSYCNIESLKVLTRNYLRIQEHELMNEVEELLSSIQITTADVAECLMSFDENPYMGMRNLVVEMRKRLLQNSRGNEETKSNKEKQNTKKKMMMEDGNESDGCESDGSNGDEPDELDCSDEMMMVTTNMMMI
ncbi:AAA-ATPase At3g50940-like [Papaver somniferum]|uniref:AAA-ATPase At3g50940-like n=1 Tax=Papaver somniferum TaxID=3469 RepID=UPI000E6FD9CE|nr:AAA-ATPase At3g50940-like [Papaver somniferum]